MEEQEQKDYETQRLDHLGIVAGICKRIKLIETIDNYMITPGGRKVSCGEASQAMVLNALGLTGRALYLMPEYLANKPIDVLIREGLEAEDFNDDSLGRALDELHQVGISELFALIASQAVAMYEIESNYVHVDTSSFSLSGQYDSDYAIDMQQRFETVKVSHGYSKENRPDLKQVVVTLITSQASSIPLWLEALDGNSSDKTSLRETVLAYTKQLEEGEHRPYFVLDSAAYSEDTLKAWKGISWITRVPETINKVNALKSSINTSEMSISSDSCYRIHSVMEDYAGVEQRWLLVYSEQAFKREQKSLDKRVKKEYENKHKNLNKLKRKVFNCKKDAEGAAVGFSKKLTWHDLEFEVVPVSKHKKAGRPAKAAKPVQLGWQLKASLIEDSERILEARHYLGRFVLASNELDNKKLSDETLLETYKEQSSSVERGFRFLKDPMFFADSLFVKSPVRIMAMTMIMGLALLVYSLAEYQLRRELKEQDETLPSQTGKPTKAITMRRVAQIFEGVDVLTIRSKTKILSRTVLNLTPLRQKILGFFSKEVINCYSLQI